MTRRRATRLRVFAANLAAGEARAGAAGGQGRLQLKPFTVSLSTSEKQWQRSQSRGAVLPMRRFFLRQHPSLRRKLVYDLRQNA
jgi:hypothetical protein